MIEDTQSLQDKIHRVIPLSQAMGYRIECLERMKILVSAPLAPNTNIHGSGFAGSLYSVAILSAWGLCHYNIEEAALNAELVVASADIRYLRPVRADLACCCELTESDVAGFLDELRQGRRARLTIEVDINDGSARLTARMVATPA